MGFMDERRRNEQQRLEQMYLAAAERMLQKTEEEYHEELIVEGSFVILMALEQEPRMMIDGKPITDEQIKESLACCARNATNATPKTDKKPAAAAQGLSNGKKSRRTKKGCGTPATAKTQGKRSMDAIKRIWSLIAAIVAAVTMDGKDGI